MTVFDQYKLPHRYTREGYMWMLAGLLPKGFIWFGRHLTVGRIVQDISEGDTGWQDGEAYTTEVQDVSEVSGYGDLLLRLLACFGAELERLGDDAYQVLNESDPGSAVWFLADWERVLGLPEIAGLPLTLEERQRQAHVKRFHAGEITTSAWYIAYAAALGFGITVEELPVWCNARIYGAAQHGLEPYGGTRGYSELRITINSADSDIALLQAMLSRHKQAHVTIEYIDAT